MSGAHHNDLIFREVKHYPTMLQSLQADKRNHQRTDAPPRHRTPPAAL